MRRTSSIHNYSSDTLHGSAYEDKGIDDTLRSHISCIKGEAQVSVTEKISRTPRSAAFEQECRYLYGQLFNIEPSDYIIGRYEQAHHYLNLEEPQEQVSTVEQIVALKLNAQAVEYSLRFLFRKDKHVLTKKMHTLCYLAENEEKTFRTFLNMKPAFLRAWFVMCRSVVVSLFLLLYGTCLIWRYDFV